MAGRIAAALVALLVLVGIGVGAGYVVAQDDVAPPTTFAVPAAVPAEEPSFPVNVYDVEPDADTAPLSTDLPVHEEKFRAGGFALRAPVPDGWLRVELPGRTTWNFTVATNPTNTYILRIGILAGERKTPGVQAAGRLFALRAQEADENSENFIIEDQDDNGFTATAIVGGYQRVIMERFVTTPGDTVAYYTVSMNGREVDRAGMVALLDQVVDTAFIPESDGE